MTSKAALDMAASMLPQWSLLVKSGMTGPSGLTRPCCCCRRNGARS